jgi:hypothetical protein
MLRKTILALFAIAFVGMLSPAVASAGGGFGDPYGDGYDYPYGYGEYAEYSPWAYSGHYGGGYDGCYPARQHMWTPYGWRLRAVQVCN